MNYRDAKKLQEKTKRKIFVGLLIALCALIAGLCVFSAFFPVESWKYYFHLPSVAARGEQETRVHYLNAKNGSCTLVELPDGKTVLVGGGADDGESRKNILRFLNGLKVEKIDALVVPDTTSRGVGALRELARFYELGAVYLPQKDGSNAEYLSFIADLEKRDVPVYRAAQGDLFVGEGYLLKVLFPLFDSSSVSELSLLLSCGGADILLGAGCSEETMDVLVTEKQTGLMEKWGVELDDLEIVQFKSGVNLLSLEHFIKAYDCKTAIFSCLGGNAYAPSEACISLLLENGAKAYKTYEDGYITVSITDNSYTITTEK